MCVCARTIVRAHVVTHECFSLFPGLILTGSDAKGKEFSWIGVKALTRPANKQTPTFIRNHQYYHVTVVYTTKHALVLYIDGEEEFHVELDEKGKKSL